MWLRSDAAFNFHEQSPQYKTPEINVTPRAALFQTNAPLSFDSPEKCNVSAEAGTIAVESKNKWAIAAYKESVFGSPRISNDARTR